MQFSSRRAWKFNEAEREEVGRPLPLFFTLQYFTKFFTKIFQLSIGARRLEYLRALTAENWNSESIYELVKSIESKNCAANALSIISFRVIALRESYRCMCAAVFVKKCESKLVHYRAVALVGN